jgi:hypothetical protein
MILATLSQVGDFAKISYNKPLKYVTNLTGYTYQSAGSGSVKLEFRWSYSNNIKTAWIELTPANLQDVKLDPNKDLWIDFRITLLAGGPIMVQSIGVEYTQDPIAQDKFLGYRPIADACECGNITGLVKIENFSFQPYKVNPAVALYKSLSLTINQLFGHSVEYARALPLMSGRDVTLKEWTLFDVDDPCCIKVIVPNNEFPDSKIEFGPLGLDFEMPFEVHIDKAYFESIFGIGTAPQKRDIVYFPLTNRIYEVQSSYLYRDIMQKPVYWKVALMKYAPKSNRSEPIDLRQQLDDISADTLELFAQVLTDDELEKTKPQQYDPKIGSSKYDPTRLTIDDALAIVAEDLKNYYTVVSTSNYDLRSDFDPENLTHPAVVYRAEVDFPMTSDEERDINRAFSAWFKDVGPKFNVPKDPVSGAITIGLTYPTYIEITFNLTALRTFSAGDLVKISRPNGFVVYGEWDRSNSPYQHVLRVPLEIYTSLNAQYGNGWPTAGSYTAEQTYEKHLFWGYDPNAQKGWRLSLFVGRYFKLYINNEVRYFILPETLAFNQWYAIFFNITNEYAQASINIWERKWKEFDPTPQNTTDLLNIYAGAAQFTAMDMSVTSSAWKNYRVVASPLIITNLRLFNSIENDTTKQQIILNQNIVEDSQLAIIIDNALPRLLLPWIAKTK